MAIAVETGVNTGVDTEVDTDVETEVETTTPHQAPITAGQRPAPPPHLSAQDVGYAYWPLDAQYFGNGRLTWQERLLVGKSALPSLT